MIGLAGVLCVHLSIHTIQVGEMTTTPRGSPRSYLTSPGLLLIRSTDKGLATVYGIYCIIKQCPFSDVKSDFVPLA